MTTREDVLKALKGKTVDQAMTAITKAAMKTYGPDIKRMIEDKESPSELVAKALGAHVINILTGKVTE